MYRVSEACDADSLFPQIRLPKIATKTCLLATPCFAANSSIYRRHCKKTSDADVFLKLPTDLHRRLNLKRTPSSGLCNRQARQVSLKHTMWSRVMRRLPAPQARGSSVTEQPIHLAYHSGP
jgi:hypothetical protein